MEPKLVVIDACCTLNILATKREVEIITAAELQLLDTPQVSVEPKYLLAPPDKEGRREKLAASTSLLRGAGLLTTRALDEASMIDALVDAAARIKDTDASCIALAGVLQVPLFSDDGKARRIARDMFPSIELLSTLDVLYMASERLRWTSLELHDAAVALRWSGNFAPPRKDPRGLWYAKLLLPLAP